MANAAGGVLYRNLPEARLTQIHPGSTETFLF